MRKGLYAATFAAAFMCASAASAENFRNLDANSDGQLTRDEYTKSFDNADTNKDGKLDQNEYMRIHSGVGSERGRFGSQGTGSQQGVGSGVSGQPGTNGQTGSRTGRNNGSPMDSD